MKKVLFFATFFLFTILTADAQIFTKPVKKQVNKTLTPPPPPPPPAPAPPVATNKSTTTDAQNTSVYTLTSVRINIRTGADNKEFPSQVGVMLRNSGCDNGGWIMQQLPENMRNEMKSNSNTEFGLEKMANPSTQCRTLESIKNGGVQLRIYYLPNFFADAWKIEGVTITLEFKDQNGVPHPTLGRKTIICNNASGFLDGSNHILMCNIDGELNPTTSSIQN